MVVEIKNSNGISGRINRAEKWISKLEDRLEEVPRRMKGQEITNVKERLWKKERIVIRSEQ